MTYAVAAAALAVVGVVAYLAQLAIARADRVGAATAATYEARLALVQAQLADATRTAETERQRANQLDDLLAHLEASGGDPGTARERVLRLWADQRANAAAAAAPRAVPAPPAAAAADRDGLLRPGE